MRHRIRQFIWRLSLSRGAGPLIGGGVRPVSCKRIRTRSALAMVVLTVICVSVFCAVSAVPSARGNVGSEANVSKAVGFDSCTLPGMGNLRWLYRHKDGFGARFAYMGFYAGGIIAAQIGCNRPSRAQVNKLHATGYDFLLLWDGRQPPCSKESKVFFNDDAANNYGHAREAGALEAIAAVKRMRELGFTDPEGSVVYYDVEPFKWEEFPRCLNATKQFVASWDRMLQSRFGVSAGLYGSTAASDLRAFWSIEDRPDDLWFAEQYVGEKEVPEKHERREINEEHKSVWSPSILNPKNPVLPDEYWPNRRSHQWEKDYPYKENDPPHMRYHFDLTCAMGLVAGSGIEGPEPKNEPLCQAK